MLDPAANSLVRVLFEPACAACGAVLERPLAGAICERCWLGVAGVAPPGCVRCGDELPAWQSGDAECARCLNHPPCFSIARSAGRYEGPLRKIVHAFKYRHRRLLAEPLGRMMRLAGSDVLEGADAVVPVPLHPFRSIKRGFNQADDLARQLGLPVWRALRRGRSGPPQASLPASARQANLTSSYGISRSWALRARLGGSPLRDCVVVVVDDVMTTGATMEACSRVLLDAGAGSVRALTAARAVSSAGQRHHL